MSDRPVRLIVGGVDKAGSSTIYLGLKHHQRILPLEGGSSASNPAENLSSVHTGIDATVERRNRLLFEPEAIADLASVSSRRLVIVSLRDPIARIVSMYRHRRGLGRLPLRMSLEEFVRVQLNGTAPSRNDDFTVVERGRYAPAVLNLLEALGEEAVRILIFEEWRSDPRETIGGILDSTGIGREGWGPLKSEKWNPSGESKWPIMMRALHLTTRKSMRPVRGTRYEETYRARVDRLTRRVYSRTVSVSPSEMPLEESLRSELLSYYESSDDALSQVLGRPLPWRA